MAITKNNKQHILWDNREKGIPAHCCLECKLVQPQWKTVWNFLKKVKMELPYVLANSISGYLSKENKH